MHVDYGITRSSCMKILDRFSGAVRFEFEAPTIKLVVETAVKSGANLYGADLRGADLYGADLRGADLYGADLRGADLRGADLYGADLRGADLRGADLRGADLRGADLRGADLRGADLRGANLRGADLRGAGEQEKLKLVGTRPTLSMGPLGSRADWLLAFLTDKGVWVRAGCFWGTLKDFASAVEKTHGTSKYGEEYYAAIAQI